MNQKLRVQSKCWLQFCLYSITQSLGLLLQVKLGNCILFLYCLNSLFIIPLGIYSIAGKLVLQKAIDTNGSINFDISNLAKGYYFIKNTNSFGINLETTFIKE